MIMVINGVGQQSTTPGTRTYDIELNPAGKITLNGTDLSMLQALAGAGAPKKP